MVQKVRGLNVVSGSTTPVHTFKADGNVIINGNSNNYATAKVQISGSTEFGRGQNNVDDVHKFNGLFVIPLYSSGSNNDVLALNSLATNPSNFVGYVLYLNSNGVTADTVNANASCKATFNVGHRWYFNRNGQWHPDPFFYVS
mgnify:FL=1|tara:strand:+ start:682 stop:1110 length:429 start_codon:yes stop_codon:yes gene_type:complete